MNDTCDRCGSAVRAVYRAARRGELYLCRHCVSRLCPALSAQGGTIWTVNELALAPQASQASDPLVTVRATVWAGACRVIGAHHQNRVTSAHHAGHEVGCIEQPGPQIGAQPAVHAA
jgi:hypothetical protein